MTDLESLPQRRHMRQRGLEMSRLETFVDAAFAFALTLLVISFDEIPANFTQLVDALKNIPAFAVSFAVIIMVWVGHRRWSQSYGLDDGSSTLLSFTLVLLIMVYVYPLRAMAAAAMHDLTGGWTTAEFTVSSYDELRGLFVIYGGGWTGSTGILALLNWHAVRRGGFLALDRVERSVARDEATGWTIVAGFGLLSIGLALALPDDLVPLAGWCYAGLSVAMPLHRRRAGRRAGRLLAAAEAPATGAPAARD